MTLKFGSKQLIGCGIVLAGFVVSTVLTKLGTLTGAQWVDFNGSFLPFMGAILLGGGAASDAVELLKARQQRAVRKADLPEDVA